MGVAGAVCCRAACAWLRATAVARGSDDACEVFGLHGTGGILGNALTAVFAASQLGGTRVVANIPAQFALHNAAALAACLWAAGCTWCILKALDALLPGGIRVSQAVEEAGLDLGEHGEEAYAFELPAPPVFVPAVAAMAAARDAN
jgi:Amt family ammonium transporter